MATEAQYVANRRNAHVSTGPGEEGKKVSRMNAYRHGLTGQLDVRTPEEQEAHDKFCAGIVSSVAPAEGVERQFAQSIAEDHWRRVTCEETVRHSASEPPLSEPYPRNVLAARSTRGRRARAIENNIFTLACSFNDSSGETESPEIDQALADARTFVADPGRFQLLTIYERRIHGNMTKNMKQLIEIQAIRHAVEAREKAEGKAQRAQAFRFAPEKASPFHAQLAEMEGVPCENGFVSSTAEIAQTIRSVSPAERSQTCRILLIGAHQYASPHDRSLAGICRR